MKPFFRSLAVVLAGPVSLFIVLRLFVRWIGVKLGFTFGTDYDFVPQVFVAFSLLFATLWKPGAFPLSLQRNVLRWNIVLTITFVVTTILFRNHVSYSHILFITFWFFLAVAAIGSSFFLFVPPTFFLARSKAALIFAAVLVGVSGFFSKSVLDPLWDPLARSTGLVTQGALKQFFPSLSYQFVQSPKPGGVDNYVVITHPRFSMSIGRGCGGLEGICLFVFIFAFFLLANRHRFKRNQWLLLFCSGVLYMYVLNLLRLSFFFIVCVWAVLLWGASAGFLTAVAFFHNSIGWCLYGLGLWLYFTVAFRLKHDPFKFQAAVKLSPSSDHK